MRSKRAKGDRLLEDALEALARALVEAGAPWMVIGGIAVVAHGVRRFTTDIDVAVRGDEIELDRLLATLARHEIEPRIDDAASFAEANLVILARHVPTGVDLDVSLAWSTFEHEALAAAQTVRFGRVIAPMSTPDDLVVFKAIANRPKDVEDAEALLLLHAQIDVDRARSRLATLAQLADAPELVAGFDAIVARTRVGSSARVKTAAMDAPKVPVAPSRRRHRNQ